MSSPATPQSKVVDRARFRLRLKTILLRAIAKLDLVEPRRDDPALVEFESELDRAQYVVFNTIHPPEERKLEREIEEAQRRLRARQLGLEDFQMRMDARLERLCALMACKAPLVILANNAEMVLQTVVDLFDRLPTDTFDERWTAALRQRGDKRVVALVETIDAYRRGGQ